MGRYLGHMISRISSLEERKEKKFKKSEKEEKERKGQKRISVRHHQFEPLVTKLVPRSNEWCLRFVCHSLAELVSVSRSRAYQIDYTRFGAIL
jgi:hypothetical protein